MSGRPVRSSTLDRTRTKSGSFYRHVLDCRGQELRFTVTDDFRAEPGQFIEVLTDPAELVDPALLDEVTVGRAWRMVVALLLGTGFVLLVVLKPVSEFAGRAAVENVDIVVRLPDGSRWSVVRRRVRRGCHATGARPRLSPAVLADARAAT